MLYTLYFTLPYSGTCVHSSTISLMILWCYIQVFFQCDSFWGLGQSNYFVLVVCLCNLFLHKIERKVCSTAKLFPSALSLGGIGRASTEIQVTLWQHEFAQPGFKWNFRNAWSEKKSLISPCEIRTTTLSLPEVQMRSFPITHLRVLAWWNVRS